MCFWKSLTSKGPMSRRKKFYFLMLVCDCHFLFLFFGDKFNLKNFHSLLFIHSFIRSFYVPSFIHSIHLLFQDNGGCSDRADCRLVGPYQRRCVCRQEYVGDGFTCIGDITEVNKTNYFASPDWYQLSCLLRTNSRGSLRQSKTYRATTSTGATQHRDR